ncbi:CRISPR-associated protein, Csa1 family [Pyrobaculum calidifontis JCM 11548]|uniref:CRISPR-associated protein, Csa1 family n=1 Tax=Pyrobaculum calidifontis (strain DSM 21063 / JCM 11548 / VA1) TaxID=410359 RepID=A3MST5_PYRCJ|nr:CRISPR-associated protein, Csa1 family [Pyrobaculum calidifontis JCM 11548]
MFRELRWLKSVRVEVSEELRGWRWDSPPVAPPPLGVRVSVSEVGGGVCETRRDVYLRRVGGVEGRPSRAVKYGAYIHEVFRLSLKRLRRLVEDGVASGWELLQAFDAEGVAKDAAAAAEFEPDVRGVKLARWLAVQVAARVDEVRSRSHVDGDSLAARAVPLWTEYVVDGRPLGLTYVRSDALAYDVVVEVKVGPAA